MIGRRLGVSPSQPPNYTATEQSPSFFAVRLLSVYSSFRPVECPAMTANHYLASTFLLI
jgi:hypothetical protein